MIIEELNHCYNYQNRKFVAYLHYLIKWTALILDDEHVKENISYQNAT